MDEDPYKAFRAILRPTVRELVLLAIIVALIVGWWLTHRRYAAEREWNKQTSGRVTRCLAEAA